MYGLYQIVYFTMIDIFKVFKSPFFILIILLIYSYYKKDAKNPVKATIYAIIYGIIGGIIATVIFIYLQVYLIPLDFLYIFVVTIALSLIDTRFVCFAYGASIVVISSLIFGFPKVEPHDLMLLVAVLHMIEAILIIINGSHQMEKRCFPLEYDSVGGYIFNRIWPLPLVLFIGDVMIKPITVVALLSYGDYTIIYRPKAKTIRSGLSLFIYGLVLLFITQKKINPFFPPILAIMGHEFIIYINKYNESKKPPLYRLKEKP